MTEQEQRLCVMANNFSVNLGLRMRTDETYALGRFLMLHTDARSNDERAALTEQIGSLVLGAWSRETRKAVEHG